MHWEKRSLRKPWPDSLSLSVCDSRQAEGRYCCCCEGQREKVKMKAAEYRVHCTEYNGDQQVWWAKGKLGVQNGQSLTDLMRLCIFCQLPFFALSRTLMWFSFLFCLFVCLHFLNYLLYCYAFLIFLHPVLDSERHAVFDIFRPGPGPLDGYLWYLCWRYLHLAVQRVG